MSQILRDTHPVARKTHRCSLCFTKIQPGEQYRRTVLLGHDGLYEWLSCQPCEAVAVQVFAWLAEPWEGYTEEDAAEWAREHEHDPLYGEVAREYLRRVHEAREQWLSKVESAAALGGEPQ